MAKNKDEDNKNHICELRERETTFVTPLWKILHVTVFFAIAIASLLVSWNESHIFKTFNYDCILYAEFELDQTISYDAVGHKEEDKIEETTEALTDVDIHNGTMTTNNDTTPTFLERFKRQLIISTSDQFEVKLILTAEKSLCGFVFFIPLLSMIVAGVFAALFLACSRGGKGYKTDLMTHPQHMAYPVIITSIIFTLLNATSAYHFQEGMRSFCIHFQTQSNTTASDELECTEEIDDIKGYFNEPIRALYIYYQFVNPAFYTAIFLWIAQAAVTALRIFFAPDYQGYIIKMMDEDTADNDEADEEDTLTFTLPTNSGASQAKEEDTTV